MNTQNLTVIPTTDYVTLIKEGITNAQGTEAALQLITADDLLNLGKTLADREAKIGELFSAVVSPINNLAEGIEKGHYDGGVYDWIKNDHSRIPLTEVTSDKRIYFVPVTENITTGEEEAYVNKFSLTLCKHAPNYLLGAMVQLKESDLPESLSLKDIVAAENTDSSVFQDLYGDRCFLYARREGGGRRLNLVYLVGRWLADGGWVFLAEKP